MRPGDLQHIGPVFRQGACTSSAPPARVSGPEPSLQTEVWNLRARERAGCPLSSQSLGEAKRQRQRTEDADPTRPWNAPMPPRATHCDDRFLQLQGIPAGYRLSNSLSILFDTQHRKSRIAVIREVAVQIAPAPILGGIHAHQRMPLGCNRLSVLCHVAAAAHRCRGLAYINPDILSAPCSNLPEVRHRKPNSAKAGGQRCPQF